MSIPAGQRDQRIQIMAPTVAQDELGQPVESWAVHASVWARVKPSRGMDMMQADAMTAGAAVVFGFNYRSDITPHMRVRWRGKDYSIQGEPVDVVGARETLELYCRIVV